MRYFLRLFCIFLFVSIPQYASAQLSEEIKRCQDNIIDGNVPGISGQHRLGVINSLEDLARESNNLCNFKISSDIKKTRDLIVADIASDKPTTASKEAVDALTTKLNKEFANWLDSFDTRRSGSLTSEQKRYMADMKLELNRIDYNTFKGSLTTIPTAAFGTGPNRFYVDSFDYSGPDSFKDCSPTAPCSAFLEYFLAYTAWREYWAITYEKPNRVALEKTQKLLMKYDNYLFESGDGMYPWELWANSKLFKKNDFNHVPDWKLHLAHPAPVVNYNELDNSIDPAVLMEVIGITKVNYNERNSLPVGASFAVDLKNDNTRFGAVIHLPLKGIAKELDLKLIEDFIPCEVCSIAILTDGDDDWSIGFKINAAGLLFSKEKARSQFRKY